MLRRECADLVIVGAGPAGLSAAAEAGLHGLSAIVADDQPRPGGQVYRSSASGGPGAKVLGPDIEARRVLVEAFERSGAKHLPQVSIFARSETGVLMGEDAQGGAVVLEGQSVLLATGALERPCLVPGWTLPGVMTAGAAQIMLKSMGMVPEGRVALAGHGPLLLLTAAQLARAGKRPAAVIDLGDRPSRLGPGVLFGEHKEAARRALGWLATLRRKLVPVYFGARDLVVEGADKAEAISFTDARGKARRVAVDVALLHAGVIPDFTMARGFGVPVKWCGESFVPEHDINGLTSLPNLWLAGDAQGILGADAAAARGRIAAIDIATRFGRIGREEARMLMAPYRATIERAERMQALLRRLAPPPSLPRDETILCRCEDVPAGEVRASAKVGAQGPNTVKIFTRCGMGPCQGRQCLTDMVRILSEQTGKDPAQIGLPRARQPVRSVNLGVLGAFTSYCTGDTGRHPAPPR